MSDRWIGRALPRREDARLLAGRGRFLADLVRPGMVSAHFVRSPVAHGMIGDIDAEAARCHPGVVGVWTLADLPGLGDVLPLAQLPASIHQRVGLTRRAWSQPALARDRVRFVGEPVAVIVAADRYVAEDAAAKIVVRWRELAAVASIDAAISPGAPLLNDGWADNVQAEFGFSTGSVDAALGEAALVLERRFDVARAAGVPIECRGVLAEEDAGSGQLTVWSSTQVPHFVRDNLAAALNEPAERIRVVAPDVGGGFGTKGNVYPEELVIAYLARLLKRPVQWIEDRREHLLAASHARDQVHRVKAAFAADGRLLAIDDEFYVDSGAFNLWETAVAYNTAAHLPGPYRLDAYRVRGRCVVTNKAPSAPYRGAGRPEAVFVIERLLDEAARKLGLDRVAIRERNLLSAADMPYERGYAYRDGNPAVYDCEGPETGFRDLLAAIDYPGFLAEQARLRGQDRYLGLGIVGFVEGTGLGPFEDASAELRGDGRVEVVTGAASQGQGHYTAFAQIAADALGIEPDKVDVREGDTALIREGVGTFASRSAVMAGSAVHQAACGLGDRLREAAAGHLECPPDRLVLGPGGVYRGDSPEAALSWSELAGLDDFKVTRRFAPPTVTYTYGFHAALVEVKPATGEVVVRRYWAMHDIGQEINPGVVRGQVEGGIVQGIGEGLREELVYAPDGQLEAASLRDYRIPNVYDAPPIAIVSRATPSRRNPLGVRGVGEGGAICPPAALANAICDALAPFGAEAVRLPLTPEAVRDLILQRQQGG